VTIFRSQSHSPFLTGYYRLFLNDTPLYINNNGGAYNVRNIPASSPTSTISNALNNYYNTTEILVEQVTSSNVLDQICYTILYYGIKDPLPLTVNVSGMNGGSNSQFEVDVTVNRVYSN